MFNLAGILTRRMFLKNPLQDGNKASPTTANTALKINDFESRHASRAHNLHPFGETRDIVTRRLPGRATFDAYRTRRSTAVTGREHDNIHQKPYLYTAAGVNGELRSLGIIQQNIICAITTKSR